MKNKIQLLLNDKFIFVLGLSLCTTLSLTTTFENSYIIGLIVLIVSVLLNFITHVFKKITKNNIFIYILIASLLVTGIELLLELYCKTLYNAFNIYLPIIILSYVLLEKIFNNPSKYDINNSFVYFILISIIGLLRELLGSGTITFMNNISTITGYRSIIEVFNNNVLPNKLFLTNGGAFILLGIIISLIYVIKNRSEL